VEDVQLRFGDEQFHQPGVGQRDDRVVVAGQDERPLPQQRQERQAGPAGAREELVQVPAGRADPVAVVHRRRDQLGVLPRRTPVDRAGHPLQVAAVQVAPGRDHAREHPWPGRHHERPGRGGDQHQPAAAGALERGEVLRDAPAPGDAEHVHLVVTKLGQQARDRPAQPGEPVRAGRLGRTAHPGRVEPDDLHPRVQGPDERLEQLQAGADAVDQQQRGPARARREPARGAHRDPQLPAADGQAADLSGREHTCRARRPVPGRPCGRACAGSGAVRRRVRPARPRSPSTSCPARSAPRPGTRRGRPGSPR
jgi:hypothetical protein